MHAIYMRISTETQTVDSQKADIEAWLKTHPLEDVQWYVDTYSGMSLDRPELERLRADIEAGNVQTVVVQRLDRLSRKTLDGLALITEWTSKGIRLVAVKQQVDLDGPVGRLVATVLLAVGEMEYWIRRERVMAGIAIAKAAGRFKGKGGRKFGLPLRHVSLTKILAYHNRGFKTKEIATMLGISQHTVRLWVRRHATPEAYAKFKEECKLKWKARQDRVREHRANNPAFSAGYTPLGKDSSNSDHGVAGNLLANQPDIDPETGLKVYRWADQPEYRGNH